MERPRQNDHLDVNKIGKNIRKCPLHQPSLAANANLPEAATPQAQPQVYNINRSDFRGIVQQLTGFPSRGSVPRPPQNNSPEPQDTRLQRIRPSPLTQINQPAMDPLQHHPHCLMRPHPPQAHFPQQQVMGQGDQFWSNTAESSNSEYMRYLQSSLEDAGPSGNHMQPGQEHRPYMSVQPPSQPRPYMPGQEHRPYMPAQPHPYMPCHEQHPYMPAQSQSQPQPYMPPQPKRQPQPEPYTLSGSQPQMNMQGPLQPSQYPPPPPGPVPSPVPRNLPPPQFNGPLPGTSTLPSPSFNQIYGGLPSPQYNGFSFGQLHSPTSQFALPSPPTSYPNMLSPRSPYPLLSPGFQYPQPPTPNFSFSQLAQSGSLGPGSGPPQPPPSTGLVFPLSPGLLPVPSPRCGDY